VAILKRYHAAPGFDPDTRIDIYERDGRVIAAGGAGKPKRRRLRRRRSGPSKAELTHTPGATPAATTDTRIDFPQHQGTASRGK